MRFTLASRIETNMRILFSPLLLLSAFAFAQNASLAPKANSDPLYQQLRHISLGGDSVAVKNFVLKRDAATFTFKSGSFYFLAPVSGKVTGAVFLGDGSFSLVPPIASEKRMLALLTKEPGLNETFGQAVFRFTDNSFDEIKKSASSTAAGGGNPASVLSDNIDAVRRKLHTNLSARILQDVLNPSDGGLFYAFIKGNKYSGKMLYAMDPHGFELVQPEEVALMTYDEMKEGIWAAFHFSQEYQNGKASGTEVTTTVKILSQNLDTQIEKSGKLNGSAKTEIVALRNGVRVVPFKLFATLRVEKATGKDDTPLAFIQEDKNEDPDFAVILPKPLAAGEKYQMGTTYSGKDAVANEGGGNYYPIAREDWYPSSNSGLGDYANYKMTFSIPKKMKMIATGKLIHEGDDGDQNISMWESEVPLAVAGFNFGKFKREEMKLPKNDYMVEAYTNESPPDFVSAIKFAAEGGTQGMMGSTHPRVAALGSMSTTGMMKVALSEGQVAMSLYSDFFGAIPYKRIAMTQQTACGYGQSWPTLIYLPICSFWDSTVRHQLGIDDSMYFKVVAAHEVAHQWFGQNIGFNSYRDQWMSEGFADMSASMFLQLTRKDNKDFMKFWSDNKRLLPERNKEGFRAIDVGPVTLGTRLANSKAGFSVYRRLVYPKGAFILHMVRMMMWNSRRGDDPFKELMHDFLKSYAGRPASTEDFKAILEKHMTPEMDLDGNHKMDWFFNEYVYGTDLPEYKLDYTMDSGKDPILRLKVTQSNVNDNFKMLVPLYLEPADGRIVKLGSAHMTGNKSISQDVALSGLKEMPKRAVLNYYHDVLAGN